MATRVLKRAARSPAIEASVVRALGNHMLEALGLERAEPSVLLADDAKIHELDPEHLGEDRDDLRGFLAGVPGDVPVTVIGLASNLLIRDGGVPGVVIRLRPLGFA